MGRSNMNTKGRGRCQLFSKRLFKCYDTTADCCIADIHFNFWSVNSQFVNRLISYCLLIHLIHAHSRFLCFVKLGTMVYRKTELLCMSSLISSSEKLTGPQQFYLAVGTSCYTTSMVTQNEYKM